MYNVGSAPRRVNVSVNSALHHHSNTYTLTNRITDPSFTTCMDGSFDDGHDSSGAVQIPLSQLSTLTNVDSSEMHDIRCGSDTSVEVPLLSDINPDDEIDDEV
jgi:hypothetical protein